jgi:arsenic resistance protein ArsH
MDQRQSPTDDFPALDEARFISPTATALTPSRRFDHPPRFLLLYGSLRERSYSRLLIEEADRLLRRMGGETRIFDPRGLPQPDGVEPDHPKVAELRALSLWSEGHVWCSPERHGAMTGVFKSQIDWLPLESGGVRPTQGRTLAVMQVNAGRMKPSAYYDRLVDVMEELYRFTLLTREIAGPLVDRYSERRAPEVQIRL